MKAQILTATLISAFSGRPVSLPDPVLLNLVMPDATVIAGVNVQQAEGTQFGQFILNQMQTQNAEMQKLLHLPASIRVRTSANCSSPRTGERSPRSGSR